MEKQLSKESRGLFTGKTVVITGSGTGIGQAIAKKFAGEGANIVIMGRRKEPLDQTLVLLNELIGKAGSGARAEAYSGVDVSDEQGIASMFEDIKQKFGKVDIVVNNAGVSGPVKVFTNASVKEFRDCVAIHLTGTFWTSVNALKAMEAGGKIITISTFFTEENRYEQRPYRFRTPYTAAQGAKNRLAEALAWEMVSRDVRSIATNPGPVHSDRIYKTVYPKAAAEFLRIGGFPGLTSVEVELVTNGALPALGEASDIVNESVRKVASEIAARRNKPDEVGSIAPVVGDALRKMQEIAEKIQNNTSKMIVDGEFLSQDDVANMVATLCNEEVSSLINGRVIPNDRVFYPVKPAIGTFAPASGNADLAGKTIVITTRSSAEKDIARIRKVASAAQSHGAKQVVVLTGTPEDFGKFSGLHAHSVDLTKEEEITKILDVARAKFGSVDAVIHLTGDYSYETQLSSLSYSEWNRLVEDFVYIPGLITKSAAIAMAPKGASEEPAKFRESAGTIIIVGPDAPTGAKVSGVTRARSDVFRGALRPFAATVNQELSDVLGSNIRLYLLLCGSIDGQAPDQQRLEESILSLVARTQVTGNESVFYIDESGKRQ